jgi:hypothetical protein
MTAERNKAKHGNQPARAGRAVRLLSSSYLSYLSSLLLLYPLSSL